MDHLAENPKGASFLFSVEERHRQTISAKLEERWKSVSPHELPALCMVACKTFSIMYRMNCFKFFFLAAIIFISHFTSVIKIGLVGI